MRTPTSLDDGEGKTAYSVFRQLLPKLNATDLLLGDALFNLAQCIEQNIDIVFEQNGARKLKTDFRTGKRLGAKDHIITLKKPVNRPDWMSVEQYHAYPETLSIRELHVDRKVLITTLADPINFPKSELKKLYRSRWHIELDIRSVKKVLGMEALSCKTPAMAEKEIWVYLLAYNLILDKSIDGTKREVSQRYPQAA